MTSIDRIKEIEVILIDLEAKSIKLRNQICLLEEKEAKIANLIAEKRKQIDLIKLYDF